MSKRHFYLCCAVLSYSTAAGVCFSVPVSSAVELRTVALSGQPAPGTPAGVTFSFFSSNEIRPGIDNAGTVFFTARLQGPGVEQINDTGMWIEEDGSLGLLAREFDNAPGYFQGSPGSEPSDLGIIFRDFVQPQYLDPPNPKIGGDRHVLRADFFGFDENEEFIAGSALYRIDAGELELITGATLPAPGANEFIAFRGVALNSSGKIAFLGIVDEAATFDDYGIWTDVRGDLELVARAGSQVQGMPPGVIFNSVGEPAINLQGKLAFGASIQEPAPSSSSKSVILAGLPGALNAVVREGDQAPETPIGTTFDRFTKPDIDAAGRLLYRAEIVGSGIDDTNDVGFWLEDAGSISLVAREGDQAPDLSTGVNYFNLSEPLFNLHGLMALHSRLAGPGIDSNNDGGIWTGTPDMLKLLVQKGGPAPGLGGQNFTQVLPVALNESDRVAIRGNFPGAVFGGASNHGIWAQDNRGLLQLIVKSGDVLEVAPGDFREVWQLQFGGFNDLGQVVFRASFRDSSTFLVTHGVFVSNLVAVPEPSAMVIVTFALLVLVYRGTTVRPVEVIFMRKHIHCLLFIAVGFACDESWGQFANVINSPPSIIGADQWMDSNTQLNVFDGGSVGRRFGVGAPDGSSINIELNVNGGTVGRSLTANGNSVVNISGGSVGSRMSAFAGSAVSILGGSIGNEFFAEGGSSVRLVGGEYRLNGMLINGLDTVGSVLPIDLPVGSVLSGTFADGSPFAFWVYDDDFESDKFENGTLTLERAELPSVDQTLITVPADPAPLGIRGGQTLIVEDGGTVGANFTAGYGSVVQINGGEIGGDFEAVGSNVSLIEGGIGSDFRVFNDSFVNISGGTVSSYLRANSGSEVNISGGLIAGVEANTGSLVNFIGGRLGGTRVYAGSEMNISGGAISNSFSALSGSEVKLIGAEFRFNGNLIDGLETVGDKVPFDLPFGAVLSGIFADGTPFAFSGSASDQFQAGTLTLEAAELPPPGPTLITAPADQVPLGIRSGQKLVVNEGGVVPSGFNAGPGSLVEIKGGQVGQSFEAVGAEVTMSAGSIDREFKAFNGSVVNVSGGTMNTHFLVFNHSVVNISGGSFPTNFRVVNNCTVNISSGMVRGVSAVDSSEVNISGGDVGVGGVEASEGSLVSITNGTISSVSITPGSILNFSGGSIERLYSGELSLDKTAIVNISGGTIGDRWDARRSRVTISGGIVGDDFRAWNDTMVTISGGEIGDQFRAMGGSEVNISGGSIGDRFIIDSVVNISGGTFGNVLVTNFAKVNLFGKQFVLDGIDITDSLVAGVPLAIAQRDVTLSGLLTDGSPFSLDLNTTWDITRDSFISGSLLTVTLVPEPNALAMMGFSLIVVHRVARPLKRTRRI